VNRLLLLLTLTAATASAQLLNPPAPAPAPAHPAPDFGKWQVSTGHSRADGSPTLAATLTADASIHAETKDSLPILIFRFKDKAIDAYVSFGTFVGDDRIKLLIIRGDTDPEEQTWVVSDDGTIAFAPDDAIALMRSFEGFEKVTFRINRDHHDPVVVTFSPKGVAAVIDAILKTAAK
jgi:hypothetical protein